MRGGGLGAAARPPACLSEPSPHVLMSSCPHVLSQQGRKAVAGRAGPRQSCASAIAAGSMTPGTRAATISLLSQALFGNSAQQLREMDDQGECLTCLLPAPAWSLVALAPGVCPWPLVRACTSMRCAPRTAGPNAAGPHAMLGDVLANMGINPRGPGAGPIPTCGAWAAGMCGHRGCLPGLPLTPPVGAAV